MKMSKEAILNNLEVIINKINACYILDKTQRKIVTMLTAIYEAIKESDLP